MKLFRPWVFQGSKRLKNYFEGWYFKNVSADRESVYAIIPGISLAGSDSHSFVQVINGFTGKTYYYPYPVDSFSASGKKLSIKIGNSYFSDELISLDLNGKPGKISGEIRFDSFNHYPGSLLKPGIMGWYSFVPLMECKHGIVSTGHGLDGILIIEGVEVNFTKGTGYIEKDWGKSFPESWIWLHCNTFDTTDASFTFSVAKIPWLGSYFIGFISYLRYKDRFYNFATWSGAKIEKLIYKNDKLDLIIEDKNNRLEIEAKNNRPGDLKAPVKGSMTRVIKETVDANIRLTLRDKRGNEIFRDEGVRGGMELIEKILEYF